MASNKITYNEVIELYSELVGTQWLGVSIEQGGIKGLLSQALSVGLKLKLYNLLKDVEKEKDTYFKLKDEFIKSLGVKRSDGQFEIPKDHANMPKFEAKMIELNKEKVKIATPNLKASDFEKLVTEERYLVFYKLLTPKD